MKARTSSKDQQEKGRSPPWLLPCLALVLISVLSSAIFVSSSHTLDALDDSRQRADEGRQQHQRRRRLSQDKDGQNGNGSSNGNGHAKSLLPPPLAGAAALSPSSLTLSDAVQQAKNEFAQNTLKLHLPKFEVSSEWSVIGPSSFPPPNRKAALQYGDDATGKDITTNLKPTYGTHRRDQDSVFLFALEYGLRTYVLFIESLRDTGYTGDIVVAVSQMDYDDDRVREYLQHDPGIVIYVMQYTCFNAEKEAVHSAKGGIRVCQCHELYAKTMPDGTSRPLQDTRAPRTMPTTRYEIYWIWATHYASHSWILLIDARDTVFQTNPFANVPRQANSNSGMLHLFGENQDAARIGQSKQNRKWLTRAYGETVAQALEIKPIICSGSTMGQRIALDTYLRAMVSESDETGTGLMGADQGFHNYLYYSNKLANAKAIASIEVHDQGFGVVNNLGAMRSKPLAEWGSGQLVVEADGAFEVLNWDGTLSPVVHQFDRHPPLNDYFAKKLATQYVRRWEARMKK